MLSITLSTIALIVALAALVIALRRGQRTSHVVKFWNFETQAATPSTPNTAYAGAAEFRKLLGMPTERPDGAESAHIEQLRQNLRLKYLYQEDKIDAAIEAERERMPQASLGELMLTAVHRFERENR